MKSVLSLIALALVFQHESSVMAARLKPAALESDLQSETAEQDTSMSGLQNETVEDAACPIAKKDFIREAKPYTYTVEATPTTFGPGGFGWKWHSNSVKIQPMEGAKAVRTISQSNFIVRGSKQGTCGLSEADFMKDAKPLKIDLTAEAYEFSTGSFGWAVNGKMKKTVGRKSLNLQYNLNSVVYGSKPKRGATDDPDLADLSSSAIEKWLPTIGEALAKDKDDLKRIKGIGPFIEKRLNHIGIYTFSQISKMTPEIEQDVVEAIIYFPGRQRRDRWVEQAIALMGKTNGRRTKPSDEDDDDDAIFFGISKD